MTGIIQNHHHKLIVINGMPDHVHILVGLHPNQSLSDLMKFAKGESSEWINKITPEKFFWQEGFGAFSYSRSQINNVIHYIENQESHHQKQSFREEYIEQLKTFDIDFNEQYIFHNLM
jgi:putative transposase